MALTFKKYKDNKELVFTPDKKVAEQPNNDRYRNNNGNSITFPTPWGAVVARGSFVIIVLLLIAGGYLTYGWNRDRQSEHEQMISENRQQTKQMIDAISYNACLQKLAIYVATSKDPVNIHLNSVPSELWNCLPKFMSDGGTVR